MKKERESKFSYTEDYFWCICSIRHAIFLPIQSIIILVSFFSRRSLTRVIDYRSDNIFLHDLLSASGKKKDNNRSSLLLFNFNLFKKK